VELVEFLLARIAEDEAYASYVLEQQRDRTVWAPPWTVLAPARQLAECEAKRRIVATIQRWLDTGYPTLDHVLFALALPYADHPDYRDEWRP